MSKSPSTPKIEWLNELFKQLEEDYLDIDAGVVEFKKGYQGYAFFRAEIETYLEGLLQQQKEDLLKDLENELKMAMVDSADRVALVHWIRQRQTGDK